MEQWCCYKCKEKMVQGDVLITYLEMSNAIEGIRCPKCGTTYLLEEMVMKLAQAEEMYESK